jgi:CPA1 family monovalent cation:H+ antiporter
MSEIELLLGLLGVVAVISWLAQKLGLPYPIFLVLAGLAIGWVPGLPELVIDPDVILLVFLPPLVHAAAWSASPRRLRAHARTVGLLAVALVGATMAGVAVVARAVVPELSWGSAFVLGAIVSPTDTVAATAIFRRLGVPERVVSLVEGESLLNDGSGLVLYRIAVAAVVSGAFSLAEAGRDLLLVGAGGALLGLLVAAAVRAFRQRVDDPVIEITVTLLTPYLAFLPAESLHLSGVLAAVSSGLYLGWRSAEDFTASTRMQAVAFWSVLIFVFESVLFILIGLQVPSVLERLGGEPAGRLAVAAIAVSGAVIAIRLAFVLGVGEIESVLDRRRGVPSLDRRERTVVAWSGMRGAVSLAAALAVPFATAAGSPFPQRELILFLTLAVIGVTLLLQGLTMPLVVRGLGVEENRSSARGKAMARFRTVQAALDRVSDMSFERDAPQPALERAREMYATRAQQLSGTCREGVPDSADSDVAAWTDLRRHLLGVERAALIELRNEGRVGLGVMREVERDLDLEEARLDRVAVPPPAAPLPERSRAGR